MAHALQWVLLGLAAVWCAPSAVFLACIALGGLARGHDTQNGCAATPAERLSRKKNTAVLLAPPRAARVLHGDDRGEGGRLYVGYDELVEQALLCLARARAAETSSLADELTRTAIHLQRTAAAVETPKVGDVVVLLSPSRRER
jgi:hypothetical protein